MPVEDFNHYNLRAHRPLLEELRDFYVNVIGLQEGFRPPFRSFGYWLYAGRRDLVHLTEAGAQEARPTDIVGTFDHMAFRCSNQEQYRIVLAQRGIPFEVDEVPLTDELQFFLQDPAGNGVELNFKR